MDTGLGAGCPRPRRAHVATLVARGLGSSKPSANDVSCAGDEARDTFAAMCGEQDSPLHESRRTLWHVSSSRRCTRGNNASPVVGRWTQSAAGVARVAGCPPPPLPTCILLNTASSQASYSAGGMPAGEGLRGLWHMWTADAALGTPWDVRNGGSGMAIAP